MNPTRSSNEQSRLRQLICAGILSAITLPAVGQNPILPPGEYIPDGEPRLFGDRVYLYGSHDLPGSTRFCDHLLKVWSAPLTDLNAWRDEGHSFHTRPCAMGHPDDVPWSNNELYAPDVIEHRGKYYLFAYVVGAPAAVAVSDSPAGPFKLVSKIQAPPGSPKDFGGWGQYIDPGVLVDDDGKVYIYWGYKRSHVAQLNPDNLTEVLPGTYQPDIIPTEKPFDFFEGCSPRKINGIYYLIYADGGILVYATSSSPTGPFKYGGPIIRNGRNYPGGNIHGSVILLNGQWYVFYHRMTNNTIFSRRACVERITFEPDGSIKEVEMTSLGFRESLDPYATNRSDVACVLKGGNYITEVDPKTHPVIKNGDKSIVGFKYFDFGPKESQGEFSVGVRKTADSPSGGTMELWLGAVDTGTHLGSVTIPADLGTGDFTQLKCHYKSARGREALYFRFKAQREGDETFKCDITTFAFKR